VSDINDFSVRNPVY